jgi:cytochrome bd-type quinol oxidase subunit 2
MTLSTGYTIHLSLNLIGVFLLVIGIIVALRRKQIGSTWYSLHRKLQLTGIVLIVSAILLGLWLRSYVPLDNATSHWKHGTAGILLGCMLLIQAWWAIVMNERVQEPVFLFWHRLFAIVIIGLIIYQIYLGMQIVKETNDFVKS